MRITRRQFIKYVSATAAALGVSQATINKVIEAIARPGAPKVIWLSGQSCGGCIEAASNMFIGGVDVADADGNNVYDNLGVAQVKALFTYDSSLANSTTVEDVILEVIDLKLMNVVNTPSGELYTSYLKRFLPGGDLRDGNFLVVVEGSVPTDLNVTNVDYCGIGYDPNAPFSGIVRLGDVLKGLCTGTGKAAAVIAYGTCASFGNIPAARNLKYQASTGKFEHTFAKGVKDYLDAYDPTHSPVVNIPVCPGHPEALALTVVDYLTYGLSAVAANLDSYSRPKTSLAFGFALYGKTLHVQCPRLDKYYKKIFSSRFGDSRQGCLQNLGCQGQWTSTPCHSLRWNRQYSNTYCIGAGIPCVGCGEKGYPDKTMLYLY